MDLPIKGFTETSFSDWDGKVVSTLFVPDCNFRCPFCHNFGLVQNPEGYETIPLARIIKFLLEQKNFIDGVCLSGGEPCLSKNAGLFEFMQRVKGMGYPVKIDTNGSDPECLKKGIEEKLIDYIALDIKGPLDERYDKLAGVKVDLLKIKQSIRTIMESGLSYEARTTVVPTLLCRGEIEEIARFISGASKFVLQQFEPKLAWDKTLRLVSPFSRQELEEMAMDCKKFVPNTILRGI